MSAQMQQKNWVSFSIFFQSRSTVSFFKVRFLGSFGHLTVLAVGFGASLAGEVSAAIFYRAKASKGS
jgi:hypothetical protein